MLKSLNIFCLYLLYLTVDIVSSDSDEGPVKSLCEDPFIFSANRLENKTVRVYRDQFYWELVGLPADVVEVKGPFKIWYLNMGKFTITSSLVTILEGTGIGNTYKTEGQKYWAWDKEGRQFAGAVSGSFWDLIPKGGFEAALHDGNKSDPTIVAFKGIYVYYFSTREKTWTRDQTSYISGKYGEKFPADLTAAFSWPADDPKDGYIAYLFKRKQYCKRTKMSAESCKWMDSRTLFGCSGAAKPPALESNSLESKPLESVNGSVNAGNSSGDQNSQPQPKVESIESFSPSATEGHNQGIDESNFGTEGAIGEAAPSSGPLEETKPVSKEPSLSQKSYSKSIFGHYFTCLTLVFVLLSFVMF